MAQTQLALYNIAATVLGARAKLTSTTQTHRVVEVFNTYYDIVRKAVFNAAWWPSMTTIEPIYLIKERAAGNWTFGEPWPGDLYLYTVPNNMLRPRHLTTYRNFRYINTGGVMGISTHETDPVLVYTMDETDISAWDYDLYQCVAYALAAYAAMDITGIKARAEFAQAQANEFIMQARAENALVTEEATTWVAQRHAVRGWPQGSDPGRYLYPHGGLIAVGETASVK